MGRKRTNYDKTLERHLRQYLLYTWREDSIKDCDGKCVITGEEFEVVHHLYPCNLIIKEVMENLKLPKYNAIKDYTDEELLALKDEYVRIHYLYGLGVCLTDKIHKEFHSLMGLNAKKEDFELYKYYKLNNLDLEEIRKCDLSSLDMITKRVKVYQEEVEYILENAPNPFSLTTTLFTMLVLSRIFKNKIDNTFYMSYKKMNEYLPTSNTSSAKEHISLLNQHGLICKIPREEYYKGMRDMDYMRLANVYEVIFDKDIKIENKSNFIFLTLDDLKGEIFEEIVFDKFDFDKKYLKNVLPVRKYRKYTKHKKSHV